jgi:DNA-binding NarL/FixJ family response regulator
MAKSCNPDVILMDLEMPGKNGISAIKEIRQGTNRCKILVITSYTDEERVIAAIRAGANGYLLKDSTYTELKLAIENVLAGRTYLSPGVSEKLVASYLEGKKPPQSESPLDALTQRERQILKLIAEGNKNRKIAEYLCISVKTVEKHRSNLMKKLDLHSASELTAYAIEHGLITH